MKQPIRVLLVEDEPGDADRVRIALQESRNFLGNVACARSLTEAQQCLAAGGYDVVLLDLSLPDTSILDAVRALRQPYPGLPIIVLTAHGDIDFALEALEAGATDYLVKGDYGQEGVSRAIRYALHRAEMEARDRLLVAALTAAANGIVITDRDARIEWCNPAFSELTGYSRDEALGHRPAELVKSGKHDVEFYAAMWRRINAGETWQGEMINRRKGGELYDEELTIAPVRGDSGQIAHFIGIKQDISARKRLELELIRLASSDPLTELPNKRALTEKLDLELARHKRFAHPPAALLMLDLDHFKRINDDHGHAAGDAALCFFSEVLRRELRTIDVPSRIGGEEFVLLLPGANREGAIALAERLRLKLAATPFLWRETPVPFTVSIGGTLIHVGDESYEDALGRADAALYRAKANGRDQTQWLDSPSCQHAAWG